jgi:hypothetical protein
MKLRGCRFVDATDSRHVLRAIAHAKAGPAEPFADPRFVQHVDRTTTEDQRRTLTDRLIRLRERSA